MTCQKIVIGGHAGVVCGRMKRAPACRCGGHSETQCDFPVAGKKRDGTCDHHLCLRCRTAWTPADPVQPAAAYRAKHAHGDPPVLDLCQPHAEMVRDGFGLGWLEMKSALAQTAPGRALAQRLEATPLATREALLDAEAARGRGYTGRDVLRVGALAEAMAELATSLRARGDAAAVFEAERRARAHLAPFGSRR
jgi:hypothetical protein